MARRNELLIEWARRQGDKFPEWLEAYLKRKTGSTAPPAASDKLGALIAKIESTSLGREEFTRKMKAAWASEKHKRRNKTATLSIFSTTKTKNDFQRKAKQLGITQAELLKQLLLEDDANTATSEANIARRAISKNKELLEYKRKLDAEKSNPVDAFRRTASLVIRSQKHEINPLFSVLAQELQLCHIEKQLILDAVLSLLDAFGATDDDLLMLAEKLGEARTDQSEPWQS